MVAFVGETNTLAMFACNLPASLQEGCCRMRLYGVKERKKERVLNSEQQASVNRIFGISTFALGLSSLLTHISD